MNQSANKSGIANTSGNYLDEEEDHESLLFNEDEGGLFGLNQEEELEMENQQLDLDLRDIFMDLGPPTRQLAPLKLRHKPLNEKLQNLIKITPPPATSSIDPFDDEIH